MASGRVEHFAISAIASRILRIPIEHIDWICSLESGLSFDSLCSVGNLHIFEVIAKMLNPYQELAV